MELVLPRSRSSLSTKSLFFGTNQSCTSSEGAFTFSTAVPHCPEPGSNGASPVGTYRWPLPSVVTPPRPHTPPPQKSLLHMLAVYNARAGRPRDIGIERPHGAPPMVAILGRARIEDAVDVIEAPHLAERRQKPHTGDEQVSIVEG